MTTGARTHESPTHAATPVTIRHELRPGDLGRIITLHAELYAREYGFGPGFEGYAIETIAEYLTLPDPERHRVWVVEQDGRLVGCIGILGRENGAAQLRWFLVDPSVRGQGLGRRLVNEALAFCRASGCRSVYLWTVSILRTAAKLYRDAGFQVTETKPEAILFDQPLVEERYDLTF